MMKILAITMLAVSLMLTTNTAGQSTGKELFVSSGCNTCHSVPSMKIVSKSATPTILPVQKRTAAWYTEWLQKKVAVNGKKHVKGWKGTSGDLGELTQWLARLK